jgi:hypothetical protein
MARYFPTLIALCTPALLLAQERPPVDPLATPAPAAKTTPGPQSRFEGRHDGEGRREGEGFGQRRPGFFGGPEAEKSRQAFQQMSPEQRERFMTGLKQFAELPPEKKMEIFQRSEYLRKKIAEDIETAIKESGLNLSADNKKKFTERYMEERKKIEEDLRKEMEELRKPKVAALIEKLKHEFATP